MDRLKSFRAIVHRWWLSFFGPGPDAIAPTPEDVLSPPAWMYGDSVKARSARQHNSNFHPMTCGGNRNDEEHRRFAKERGHGDNGILVAIEGGWVCPVCDYTQPLRHPTPTQQIEQLHAAIDDEVARLKSQDEAFSEAPTVKLQLPPRRPAKLPPRVSSATPEPHSAARAILQRAAEPFPLNDEQQETP